MSTDAPSRERVAVTVPPFGGTSVQGQRDVVCDRLILRQRVWGLVSVRAVAVEADAGVIGRYFDRVARRRIQVRRTFTVNESLSPSSNSVDES